MKLLGSIHGEEVVVMIDPGATHNFLSLATIHKTHIPIHPTTDFGVTLGTDGTVTGSGECQDVVLNLGALEITVTFFPLDLGTSDVILGINGWRNWALCPLIGSYR